MMEENEDIVKTDEDLVKHPNNEMTKDAPINEGNTKWAIKTKQMSGSKLHLLSTSNENLDIVEAGSNSLSVSRSETTNNITSSSPSILQVRKMHKRKVDKEDSPSSQRDVSPSVSNFVNEVCTDASDDSFNPDIPESIFGTVAGEDGTKDHPRKELSIKLALLLLFLIFAVCLGALAFVYSSFPKMNEKESEALKFPSNIEDAKLLGQGKFW